VTPDDAAFITAICAAGADPYPRMVYADRLPEQGRACEEMFWRWAGEGQKKPLQRGRGRFGWTRYSYPCMGEDMPNGAVPFDVFVALAGGTSWYEVWPLRTYRTSRDAWLALRDAWVKVHAAEAVTSQ
jgi:uncharacterized protein (TIGR02996 family)